MQFCRTFAFIFLFNLLFFVSLALFPWVSGHMLVKPSGPPDSISLFSRLFRERLSSGSARSCLRLHLTSLTGIPVWTFSRFLVEQSFRQVECFFLSRGRRPADLQDRLFFLRGIRLLLPSEPVVQQVSRCPLVMLTFSDWGLSPGSSVKSCISSLVHFSCLGRAF